MYVCVRGFRRLFFHTLLFPPDNLMSIFFSSGIKTLWSSFSAFVLYEAAQWGWETHTTLRRSSVVLPTECPTNYWVQTRSYHSVSLLSSDLAAVCTRRFFSPLFSFRASNRDGCWSRHVSYFTDDEANILTCNSTGCHSHSTMSRQLNWPVWSVWSRLLC